ncbi:MAG: hypothetical protein WC967_15275 [Balneolaceae bacterium]
MKQIFFILFSLLFIGNTLSQTWEVATATDNYVIYKSEINYLNKVDDINHQRIIFKYENLTNNEITLHFNRDLTYKNANGINEIRQDEDFKVTISANSSIEYDSKKIKDKTFYVFKKDNNGYIKSQLLNFDFININASKQ